MSALATGEAINLLLIREIKHFVRFLLAFPSLR